jgi:antitoxin (DNA-binding transcriptional repressor) of toxin-antitoxin stability system
MLEWSVMNTVTIPLNELPARLTEAIDLARGGTEVVVEDTGGPVVKLLPVPMPSNGTKPRILGMHPGALEMSPDFNEPLPDEFWFGIP